MRRLLCVVLLALAAVADAGVSINNPFYCYGTDIVRPQVQMHSVRSSYEAVRRTSVDPNVSCELLDESINEN